MKVSKRIIYDYLAFLLIASVITLLVFDLTAHLGSWFLPRYGNCKVLVVDVYSILPEFTPPDGVCVLKGLTWAQFRELGNTDVKRIIIVTHAFVDENGHSMLGVSDPQWIAPIIYPITSFTSTAIGDADNRSFVAVDIDTWAVANFEGKEVVLVTCGSNTYLDDVIRDFIEKGAKYVATPVHSEIPEDAAFYYVRWGILNPCNSTVFVCHTKEKSSADAPAN